MGRKRVSRGNGIIRGRKAPMIQSCPTCGQMRIHHPGNNLYACPVPVEVTTALREYAKANGKRWKSKLCGLWTKGDPTLTAQLQMARNMIGPRRLYVINLEN